MVFSWHIAVLFVASYLVGSIPFGLIVSRLKGVDIRQHGSGNLGATNVGRVLGRKWGALVLLLDVAKGALTSIGANLLLLNVAGPSVGVDPVYLDWVWLGTGVCCVLGNTAPIYLRFKGGKGVATTLGVILGIWPFLTIPALATLVVWAAVVKLSRYVSLGSIVAACFMPLAFVVTARIGDWPIDDHYPLLGLTLVVGSLVVFRHRSNIGRLLSGTENKVGDARS